MKNGGMFFPIKADIRKVIKKEAGDRVKITLYRDAKPELLSMNTKKKQPLPKDLRL
jgi:hypothetical protein